MTLWYIYIRQPTTKGKNMKISIDTHGGPREYIITDDEKGNSVIGKIKLPEVEKNIDFETERYHATDSKDDALWNNDKDGYDFFSLGQALDAIMENVSL